MRGGGVFLNDIQNTVSTAISNYRKIGSRHFVYVFLLVPTHHSRDVNNQLIDDFFV